ncbi:MAG: dihydropteroate synthase [Anaerolineae bacterium]
MQTVLTGTGEPVTIGPSHAFVVIGERLNPSLRPALAAEMAAGDFSRVNTDGLAQVEAGARMLDISAPPGDEKGVLLSQAVQTLQQAVDVPLCISITSLDALHNVLAVYEGKPLVNGLTGDRSLLDAFLPVIADHGAAFVGMCTDENGIPEEPTGRLSVAHVIVDRAIAHGLSGGDVMLDPVVMPIGARRSVGHTTLDTIRLIRGELGVNTLCGATNISIGLPNRRTLNAAFLAMLIAQGMPAAITNPLDDTIRMTALAADMFMGHDENSERWLIANRRGADLEARRLERQEARRKRQSKKEHL